MKCIKCQEQFMINMKTGMLCCSNINCNFTLNPMKILWTCAVCGQDFKSKAIPYNPLEVELIKKVIRNTLLLKHRAHPNKMPCCQLNVYLTDFYHKKICRGLLYEGELNDRMIIVCEKCRSINFHERFIWTCPKCGKKFRDIVNALNKEQIEKNEHKGIMPDIQKEYIEKEKNEEIWDKVKKKSLKGFIDSPAKKNHNFKGVYNMLMARKENYEEDVLANFRLKALLSGNNLPDKYEGNDIYEDKSEKKKDLQQKIIKINNPEKIPKGNLKNSPYKSPKRSPKNSPIKSPISSPKKVSFNLEIQNKNKNKEMPSDKDDDLTIDNDNDDIIEFEEEEEGEDQNKINLKNNFKRSIKPSFKRSIKEKTIGKEINEKDKDKEKEKEKIKLYNFLATNQITGIDDHLMNNINKKMNNILSKLKIPLINVDDYTFNRKLGEGSYGIIYSVVNNNDNKKYAIKKIIARSFNELESFTKEFELVFNCDHPNIMKIYGISIRILDSTTYSLYVLMEMAKSDWDKEIKKRLQTRKKYTEIELINIIRELADACLFLQKKLKISHRDIKPQNILVFENGEYKLADFGEAKEVKISKKLNTLRGTELYMSPVLYEGLKRGKNDVSHDPFKSDVFSLGFCLLYAASLNFELLYEARDCDSSEVIQKILNKSLIKKAYSDKLISIIYNMLLYEEKKRFSFQELLNFIEENYDSQI